MMHWRELGTEQKINAIKGVYRPGMSASYIAAAIGKEVTRNAVIGMYGRHSAYLADCPLRPPREITNGTKVKRKARARSVPSQRPAHWVPPRRSAFVPARILTAPHVAGIPLDMLKRDMCKFAVNDAAKGETHLFCASPADGSFCSYHRGIVYRQQSPTRD